MVEEKWQSPQQFLVLSVMRCGSQLRVRVVMVEKTGDRRVGIWFGESSSEPGREIHLGLPGTAECPFEIMHMTFIRPTGLWSFCLAMFSYTGAGAWLLLLIIILAGLYRMLTLHQTLFKAWQVLTLWCMHYYYRWGNWGKKRLICSRSHSK